MAELLFFAFFDKITPRVPIFKNQNDLLAYFEVLAREVGIAVKETQSLFRALVLLPADGELAGYPRGQAIPILHSPPLASPLDILFMMIGKELFLDIEDELFQSIHAIGAPFPSHNDAQFRAQIQ
jgi:hypothetical protein